MPHYRLADREFCIAYSNPKFLSLKVEACVDIAVEHLREANETH